jgi:uncharacterized protein (TIGR02246 family)
MAASASGALSAQDRVEMTQLVARYNHAADAGDAEAFADTFTPDGVFKKDGAPEVVGRDALVAMVRARVPGNARHWTLNLVIDGEGERATMLADFALLRENRIELSGRYRNELVKLDGAWKFARRELTTHPRPASASRAS